MSDEYTGDAQHDSMKREVRERAQRWLVSRGLLVRGDSPSDRMRRLAEYRQTIKTMQKPEPKQWARLLLARHRNGDRIYPHLVRMATDALGLSPEPKLMTPDPKPPRPDARERQAGDVEVSF